MKYISCYFLCAHHTSNKVTKVFSPTHELLNGTCKCTFFSPSFTLFFYSIYYFFSGFLAWWKVKQLFSPRYFFPVFLFLVAMISTYGVPSVITTSTNFSSSDQSTHRGRSMHSRQHSSPKIHRRWPVGKMDTKKRKKYVAYNRPFHWLIFFSRFLLQKNNNWFQTRK